MARLPAVINDQDIGASNLQTGSDFYRPIQGNTDVGKGLEVLGKGVTTVGVAVLDEEDRIRAKAESQAKADQNTFLQSQLLTYGDNLQTEALNRQQNMPAGGFGYSQDFAKFATDQASDAIAKNFEGYDNQAQVALAFQKVRDQAVRQATVTEYNARVQWRGDITKQTVADLSGAIGADPANFENAKSQFLDYASKSFAGQDNARAQIEQDGLHKLAVAEAQSIAARNPEGFRTAFNGAFQNQPAAASEPHVAGIVDAANNNQLNPSVLLGIAKIELGIDPNIGPNSKSSAAGMWQIMNDPATLNAIGISAKDRMDPTIATPAVAAYIAKQKDDIEASGQQATPGKLYMAYNLGPGAAAAIRNADPNTPIESVIARVYGNRGPAFVNQVLENNPSLYKRGMTAGQVVNNYETAMARASSDTAGYITGQNMTTDQQAHSVFASVGVKGSEYLTANDAAQIFTETNAKIGEATQEQQKLARGVGMLNGDITGDRYATKDQEAVDEVVAKAGLSKGVAAGDPAALSGVRARTEAVGFIPLPDVNGFREAINSGGQNPGKLSAYAALTDISTKNPTAYDASKLPTDERGRINEYRAYTEGLLLSPAEAVKRIDDQRTPEGKQAKQAMAKQFEGNKGELAQLNFSDISKKFDQNYTSDPTPVNDASQSLMMDAYRTGYQYWREQGHDAEEAKALALQDFGANGKRFGVSNLNVDSRSIVGRVVGSTQTLMPFPPENNFPAVGSLNAVDTKILGSGATSWDYITDQARNVVATQAMLGRIPDYYKAVKGIIPGGTQGFEQNTDIEALADKMTSGASVADKLWNLSAGVAANKEAGEAGWFGGHDFPIRLVPRVETAEDFYAGKPLRYELWYQKPDGTKDIIPGRWFTPNSTLAQQQYDAAFKQRNDAAVASKVATKAAVDAPRDYEDVPDFVQ